jgi:hypothetical protein
LEGEPTVQSRRGRLSDPKRKITPPGVLAGCIHRAHQVLQRKPRTAQALTLRRTPEWILPYTLTSHSISSL